MMMKEQNKGIKILSIATIIFMFLTTIYAEEAINGEENRKNPNNIQISTSLYHPKIKRAWNQLQNGGWGKRNIEENEDEESNDLWNRKLMKMYAEQLLGNKQNDDDVEYYDNGIDKRAWSQFNGGWGKRDWNQLRGNAWGKRREWNKLSSVWGKK
ncbi:prothoracicostatic peptides [Chironomus tepperi]|uniref:prothoracicostatic peptides n=1 Tax=Chironomus tepperi TaxID=113505 RepID=UPI00391F2CBD